MSETIETEFKLRAIHPLEVAAVDAALRELGVAARTSTNGSHADTYLDDGAGSLARAGIGLRLRRGAGGQWLTVKTRGTAVNGRFERSELEVPWPGDALPGAAREMPAEVRDAIEPFVLDRPLAPWLALVTSRDTRVVQQHGNDMCELAIDRVEATAHGHHVVFHELELEVIDDAAASELLARALEHRLPVRPAEDDKPTHAAALLGLPALGRTDVAPVGADAPFGETVMALVQRELAAMRAAEPGVRRRGDAEPLHTMRVASRTLRCLVRACRDLWPAEVAETLLDRLRETGRQLGAVRDHDVLLESLVKDDDHLPEPLRQALPATLDWLRARRDEANERLQRWLRSDARLQFCRQLEHDLGAIDATAPAAVLRTADAVPARVAHAVARLRKLLAALPAELPLEPLHEARIAAKRLRYFAAAFADLPTHDYTKSLAAIVKLQQVLGEVCDHENAVQTLTGWIDPIVGAGAQGAKAAAVLGAFAALRARGAEKARRRAVRVLERVDRGKVWRRFPGGESDANVAT